MNLKSMFGIGLVSLGTAFAQDGAYDSETYSTPSESTVTESTETAPSASEQELQRQQEQAASAKEITAPVPFVAPTIPSDSKKSSFNSILHGKSYNKNSNMAAANNTDLLLRYPNLFANRKFFYIEPTNKMGILSLGSFFTAFDISPLGTDAEGKDLGNSELGRLTLGYAVPGFGFYIRGGLGRERTSDDNGVESKTFAGDDWAFAIAKSFIGMNLAVEGDWLTKKEQTHEDPDNGVEREQRYNSLTLGANITNAPTAKNFTWTLGARFLNYLDETQIDGEVSESDDPNSFWRISPYFRAGLSVLENENARVLVGGAAILSYTNFDDPSEVYEFRAMLQPSVLGEIFVGEQKNFMFYGEFGYNWDLFVLNKDNASDKTTISDEMFPVVTSVGFRYQYKDFLSVEFGIGDSLFSGSGNFFNGTHTFLVFSAMFRF